MTFEIVGWSQAERRLRPHKHTKQQIWQWLKAERQWQDKVRQWLRAEGVSGHILTERRLGRPEAPRYFNRAGRRRMSKSWKRIAL